MLLLFHKKTFTVKHVIVYPMFPVLAHVTPPIFCTVIQHKYEKTFLKIIMIYKLQIDLQEMGYKAVHWI